MSILFWVLGIYWALCSVLCLFTDLRGPGLEEETVFDNVFYYIFMVPIIISGEIVVEIIQFFRGRLQ